MARTATYLTMTPAPDARLRELRVRSRSRSVLEELGEHVVLTHPEAYLPQRLTPNQRQIRFLGAAAGWGSATCLRRWLLVHAA